MLVNKFYKFQSSFNLYITPFKKSKNISKSNSLKFFSEKHSSILYVQPKFYANINQVSPPEVYSEENFKLTFGY